MSKPLPRRIDSSDCAVIVDGAVYYPHEGEWVEMFAGATVGELQATEHIRRMGVDLQALKGEPDEYTRMLELLDPHYEELYARLSRRLVAWSWTDDRGEPLGDPTQIETLRNLRPEELYWLLFATQGETPNIKKKGSNGSQTFSSAIESLATRSSTRARNRGRAS